MRISPSIAVSARLLAAAGVAAICINGCASRRNSAPNPDNAGQHEASASEFSPRTVRSASEAEQAALLDRIKQLEGTWEMPGPDGNMIVASVFSISSAGSTVREVMFPGSEHEMTNMYHMDGPTLIMTHYCAAGNQPRMRAQPSGRSNQIALKFDDITNLESWDDRYFMGAMTITFVDDDHITQEWVSYQKGAEEGRVVFELTRRR